MPEKENIKDFLSGELSRIMDFWATKAVDNINGGFFGQVDFYGNPDPRAEKGIILNTRILWTFSAAFNFTSVNDYKVLAERAYKYLINYFADPLYGGVYWSIDSNGNPLNKRKQVYAQAFMIYALTEYYKFKKDKKIIDFAVNIYNLLEKYSFDPLNKGYIEAFGEKWNDLDDVRLSEKDDNQKKTMNTHLHVLEAYTSLYKVWKDDGLKESLKELIEVFFRYIINNQNSHLNLFFNEKWELKSAKTSFGHEIETSWLLYEAAEALDNPELLKKMKDVTLLLAKVSLEGMDNDGGLMNEYDVMKNHLDTDKHWWPQAEAMVGYLNAFQLSGDAIYWTHFRNSVNFIKDFIIDKENGEWRWKVDRNHKHFNEEKAGFWKCPYHNSRACIESISRLNEI